MDVVDGWLQWLILERVKSERSHRGNLSLGFCYDTGESTVCDAG